MNNEITNDQSMITGKPIVSNPNYYLAATAAPVLQFQNTQEEILRLETSGDIYIKGKLVTNDLEIVEGLREFLVSGKYPERSTSELSKELAKCEGVEEIVIAPHEPYKLVVAGFAREMTGPAIILINTD
jgi:hypothetical protein